MKRSVLAITRLPNREGKVRGCLTTFSWKRRYFDCDDSGNPMTSVLFVSHDSDLLAAATRVLTHAGCQVTAAAHSGHATLACMEGRRFDVLVIGGPMPDVSSATLEARVGRYRDALDDSAALLAAHPRLERADELHLLLEGARVTAQSVGRDGLSERVMRMCDALITAHAEKR